MQVEQMTVLLYAVKYELHINYVNRVTSSGLKAFFKISSIFKQNTISNLIIYLYFIGPV